MQILTPHDARIAQLTRDNLIDFYRSAAAFKTTLFPSETIPAPVPVLGSIGCKKEFLRKHDAVHGPLSGGGYYDIADCYVGKCGTLLDADRKVLWGDDLVSAYWMWFLGKMLFREVVEGRSPKPSKIGDFVAGRSGADRRIEGTVVVLVKPGVKVYGHWILDTLPLLYNFFEIVRRGALVGPFRFLISSGTPGWAVSFMKMLFDIEDEQLIRFDDDKEVVHLERAIVPGLLRISPLLSGRMNDFSRFVVDRLAARHPEAFAKDHPREIFISRGNFANDLNRNLLNADEVLATAAAEGLVPVQPELMPWPEQIALFSRARIVAGEYGSGLHNTLFSPPDTVAIVYASLKMNWTQSAICGLRGQRIFYVQPASQERVGTSNGIVYSIAPDSIRQSAAAARAFLDASDRRTAP